MRRIFCLLIAIFLGQAVTSRAEEKNGMMLTVTKKTLDRNDTRTGSYYSSDRIDRTQGLKVTVKNCSLREMPAGELKWTLLVRKYYSGSSVEGYTGTEPVKALKPSESVELMVGAAQIQGWNDMSGQSKDKIEHQVVVTHNAKETIRVQSMSNFDLIASRAYFNRTPIQRGPPPAAPGAPPAAVAPTRPTAPPPGIAPGTPRPLGSPATPQQAIVPGSR